MSSKKDVLEFPLKEISVPESVALMMQAATQCRTVTHVEIDPAGVAHPTIRTDNDRLQLLCEKLEARIQDDLDDLLSKPTEVNSDGGVDPLEIDVSSQIFADGMDADDSEFLNWQGRLFKKVCNERVVFGNEEDATFCIKQWGHNSIEHEDLEGNVR